MLIEFSVGNYRSFRKTVTLSMVAAKLKAKDAQLDASNSIDVDKDLKVLKSAAIYGANASGKSNLAHALAFMQRFVLHSSKETQAAEAIKVDTFRLNTETEGQPAFFEIVFVLAGTKYRYGFKVDTKQVVAEWLFYVPSTREAKLFIREQDNIDVATAFKASRELVKLTRENALFLSVVAQFNGVLARQILGWFRDMNVISGIEDLGYRYYTIQCLEDPQYCEDIIRFVKNLDLSIYNLQIEERKVSADTLPSELSEELKMFLLSPSTYHPPTIKTLHKKYNATGQVIGNEAFDLDEHESRGTAKLFSLAGPIVDTLKNGKILIVDELESHLHPLVTLAIIQLFHSSETNPKSAQLIFMTHDTNLLSNKVFRRDQIWFVEKDREGATDLYSLAEYKIRNDASFESDYMKGRYGAVPFLGDIRRLVEVSDG
jgi:AAA15 family ATPase/GTPase